MCDAGEDGGGEFVLDIYFGDAKQARLGRKWISSRAIILINLEASFSAANLSTFFGSLFDSLRAYVHGMMKEVGKQFLGVKPTQIVLVV